jgi:hypothetical protein
MNALSVTASAGNRFKVKIIGRPGTGGPGIDNWNSHVFNQVWAIATTNGVVSGFDPDAFEIDVTQFNNNNANNGRFEVRYNATTANVEIHYVPEPAGLAILLASASCLLVRRQRSRLVHVASR